MGILNLLKKNMAKSLKECVIQEDNYPPLPNRCGTHELAYFVDRQYGTHINSTHQMNLILERMGLIEHNGSIWFTTDVGVPFTIFRGRGSTGGNRIWYQDELVPLVGEFVINDPDMRRRYYE